LKIHKNKHLGPWIEKEATIFDHIRWRWQSLLSDIELFIYFWKRLENNQKFKLSTVSKVRKEVYKFNLSLQ